MKGNVVQYNFLRMENKELHDLAYAIVIGEKEGMLTLLPFNNKFTKDSIASFCLGKIEGFLEIRNEGFIENDGQYVHFDKIVEVPASDVTSVYKQDTYGSLLKDSEGNFVPVSLNEDQLKMVDDRQEIFEEGEATTPLGLIFKADKSYKLDYNSISSSELLSLGNTKFDRYREYNFGNEKIVVFFIDGKRYSLTMRKEGSASIAERNNEISEAFKIA